MIPALDLIIAFVLGWIFSVVLGLAVIAFLGRRERETPPHLRRRDDDR